MTTRITVDNGFSTFHGMRFFGQSFRKHGRKALIEWMREIKKRTVFGITRNKTGKARRGKGSKKIHRASQRGQYPAADTSLLHRSIKDKILSGGFAGHVFTNKKYGRFLEEKDPDRGGRPFLSRAAREKEPLGRALVLAALKRSAREAS